MLQKFNTNFLQFLNFNPVSSLDLRFECRMGQSKVGFFFRKCDLFLKSPNLQKKITPNQYPELEI